jgi:hypothetical protein
MLEIHQHVLAMAGPRGSTGFTEMQLGNGRRRLPGVEMVPFHLDTTDLPARVGYFLHPRSRSVTPPFDSRDAGHCSRRTQRKSRPRPASAPATTCPDRGSGHQGQWLSSLPPFRIAAASRAASHGHC